jgi:hypothetical protein
MITYISLLVGMISAVLGVLVKSRKKVGEREVYSNWVWLFLALPVVAFAVSAAKTYKDGVDAGAARTEARRAAARAEERQNFLSELAELRRSHELAVSEERRKLEIGLSEARRKQELDLAEQRRMREAEAARANLFETRERLSQQGQINLITVLSRGPAIREGTWWLNFNAAAAGAPDLLAYLASRIPEPYRAVVKLEMRFQPFLGINSIVDLTMDGNEVRIDQPSQKYDPKSPPPEIRPPPFLDRSGRGSPFASRRASEMILIQAVGEKEGERSAAIAFRDLSRRERVATLTLKFARDFPDIDTARKFSRDHGLSTTKAQGWKGDGKFTMKYPLPATVARQVATYWGRAIAGSSVHLYLDDNDSHLMISSAAALKDLKISQYEVSATFVANSEPKLEVGIEEIR